MKKICVYTCITGDYDEIKEFPNFREEEFDYYLFTNNKTVYSDFWQVIYVENEGLDNIRLARKIKVLGHDVLKKYDVTVWLDGASYPRKKISEFLKKCCDLEKYSLVGFQHRERDCIYDEALECVKVRKDKKEIIAQQMKKYKQEQYPEHHGLIESTILVRRNHDENLDDAMNLWFQEILNYSYRDQLSFNYVANKTGLNYLLLEKNVFDNEYFGWEKHYQKKILGSYFVHFGESNDFDYNSLVTGEYQVVGNRYTAIFKCPKNVNEFKIEFANFRGLLFSNMQVTGKNIERENLVNYSQYFEYQIFDNDIPTLFLYGNFKKGQIFKISIDLEVLSEEFYLDLLKRFNTSLIQCLSVRKKERFFTRLANKIKK